MSQRRRTDGRTVVGVCLTFVVTKYLAQATGFDSLFLDVALKFTREPEDATAPRGSRVVLDCSANSSNGSDVLISWRKDGELLTPDGRRLLLANGSLVIQQFSKQRGDEGIYECIASAGGYTLVSHQAELLEEAGPFSGRPSSTSVPVGGNTRFECPIDGILKPNITWRKNGIPLPSSDRIIQLTSGVLQLLNVAASDIGSYSCHASIFGREADSPVADLSIESGTEAAAAAAPVRLLSRPDNQEVRLGSTVTFECLPSVSGYSVLWSRKDGVAIPHNRSRTFGCGNLEIQGVLLTDVANYSCEIANVSSVGAQAKLTVTGTSPIAPSGLRAHSIDSRSIELTWDPSPTFVVGYSVNYWSLPDGKGRQEVVTRHPPQRITNLQPFTNYTFYVKTYNRWGDSEPSQYIVQATLEDVPVAAPTVHIDPLTVTSLRISWDQLEPHEARGVVVQYKIFYRKQGAATANEITVPGTTLRYDLTDLEANDRYSVRVLAATTTGFPRLQEDQWPWTSRTVGVSTDNEGNTNLEIHILNATTVQIIWGPPKLNEDGLEICFNLFGGQPKTVYLVADQTEHILDGLVPDSDYDFEIRILLNDGTNGDLYTRTVRMPPLEMPPSQPPRLVPVILEAAAVNDTAIQVSWRTTASDAGSIVSYVVRFIPTSETNDGEEFREILLNRTETSIVVTGLMPSTEYEIVVRSYYGDGPGPFSKAVTCRTEEGRPPALLHLTWFLQGPTAVQLNWKMPPHDGPAVSKYVIFYCEDKFASGDQWKDHVENGSLCYTIINGLKGRTVYQIRLHAENRNGPGPVSSLKVLTGIPHDEGRSSNDRLMGIVIGVGISGGCIVICIVIILLRNRCFPPPRRSPALAKHANGVTTPQHCKGCVIGYRDGGRCDGGHEPDGTTPMLPHSQDHETEDGRLEMSLPGQVDLWSSADNRRTRSVDRATAVV